jgi:hypothetical protein
MHAAKAVAIAFLVAVPAVRAGDKPVRSVRWAVSWSEAVEEARALNVPIVVHRHGFY